MGSATHLIPFNHRNWNQGTGRGTTSLRPTRYPAAAGDARLLEQLPAGDPSQAVLLLQLAGLQPPAVVGRLQPGTDRPGVLQVLAGAAVEATWPGNALRLNGHRNCGNQQDDETQLGHGLARILGS